MTTTSTMRGVEPADDGGPQGADKSALDASVDHTT